MLAIRSSRLVSVSHLRAHAPNCFHCRIHPLYAQILTMKLTSQSHREQLETIDYQQFGSDRIVPEEDLALLR